MADPCDREFKDIIQNVCECIPNIANPAEQNLVNQWVNKLSRENYSDDARMNRNDYARYLQYNLNRNNLHYPFACAPPRDGLQPLESVLEDKKKSTPRTIWPVPCSERERKEQVHGKAHALTSSTASIRVYGQKQKKEGQDVVDCNRMLLRRIIAELGSHMSLPQFVGLVAPQTCDRGSILRKVMGEEQVNFRNLVEKTFATRNLDVGELLAREQCSLQERYESWRQRMCNRKNQSEALLQEIIPNFDWDQYSKCPKYLENIFRAIKPEDANAKKQEQNFKEWRQHMMHKIAFLREQTKDIMKQNEEMTQQLTNLRREHHERQTEDTMNEQMLHEKNHSLSQNIRELRQRRDFNQQRIDALFQQIEACECKRDTDESESDNK